MIDACDSCLRRSHLVGFLAADVERLLPPGGPARAAAAEVGTETLLAAVPEHRRADAQAFMGAFDANAVRQGLGPAEAVCVHAAAYPLGLRNLSSPPAVLYATRLRRVLGADDPAVAVVGSRRPSEYGRTMAHRIARGLGAARVQVVSGLALGIDAVAHRACLDAGGPTVAVMAGGVDVAYPRTNRALYERIWADGAVVSEMPPGTRPMRWLFPARNRIMAALSRLTVVVEASERSGTLITADRAAEIGRDVAAVPGQATSEVAAGTNGLLSAGAALVTGPQDVLDLLYGAGAREVPAEPAPALDERERAVLDAVSRGEDVDSIALSLGLGAGPVRAALARLELRGLVRRGAAGAYVPGA